MPRKRWENRLPYQEDEHEAEGANVDRWGMIEVEKGAQIFPGKRVTRGILCNTFERQIFTFSRRSGILGATKVLIDTRGVTPHLGPLLIKSPGSESKQK